MNDSNPRRSNTVRRSQSGFTLVELMVAVTIALFLLGGLFASMQSTRRAYGNQNMLSQLQDNERLAMSLMATVIESAGYFPSPQTNTSTGLMPAAGVFAAAGQSVFGTTGDTITVRYVAGPIVGVKPDNVYSCIGTQNTTAGTLVLQSTFKVAGNQLICTYNGVDYPLVNSSVVGGVTTLGVQSMTILYGVKANLGDTGSCTDTYMTAAQVAAYAAGPLWNSVCSINVTLNFINPLNPAGAPIKITRIIAIMNTAGVNS
jgi:type IV pilus assembly protein PilW